MLAKHLWSSIRTGECRAGKSSWLQMKIWTMHRIYCRISVGRRENHAKNVMESKENFICPHSPHDFISCRWSYSLSPLIMTTYADKSPYSQSHGFSSNYVSIWKLDHKESWAQKNWCFWTVVLKTLESPLDCKEIKPVHPKGNQSWIFIGRTDAKAEAPLLWPPNAKTRLFGKDPDPGKDWRQEKGTTEDEMDGIIDLMDMSLSKLRELVMYREAWHVAVHGVSTSQTWVSDWTDAQSASNI